IDCITGKWSGRKEQAKTLFGAWNCRDQSIDHGVDTGDKGLSVETDARVVEDPHALIPVRRYHSYGIHRLTRDYFPYNFAMYPFLSISSTKLGSITSLACVTLDFGVLTESNTA